MARGIDSSPDLHRPDPAPRSADGAGQARKHRAALVAAMAHWRGTSEEDPYPELGSGYKALRSAILASGEGVGAVLDLVDDARPQVWRLDLDHEARRLSGCETAGVILHGPNGWRGQRCGCGSRLCPVCARARSARMVGRWRPVLEAAAADGAVLRHVTLTQPAVVADGGLVTPHEARRYGWTGTVAAEGAVARAVGGEGLGQSYDRLRLGLRKIRKNDATAATWRAFLGGYILGCEWTGRGPGGVPRWHVHAHVLTCTPSGRDVDVPARLVEWARKMRGSPRAQHCREVEPDAVIEVLKYPFKPAALTSAQRIETLAYMRGLHPHQVAGSWHSASHDHRQEPWSRWLAARPDPPRYRRLHWIADPSSSDLGTREPQVWRGVPDTGRRTFALRRDDGTFYTFEADAERFVRLLATVDPDFEPTLEPGSDLEEDAESGDDS